MIELNIKPLSINAAFQGRRFKTQAYKEYESAVLFMLRSVCIPTDKIRLELIFGLSNKGNDIDNSVKPFIDILQKKYGFNDSRIYELNIKKEIVKKGNEFIKFKIEKYEEKT